MTLIVPVDKPSDDGNEDHGRSTNGPEAFTVRLSRPVFILVWWLFLSFRLLSVVAYGRVAIAYITILHDPAPLTAILHHVGIVFQTPTRYVALIGALVYVFYHLGAIGQVVVGSFRQQHLMFPSNSVKILGPRRLRRLRANRWIHRFVTSVMDLVSVRGHRFELWLMVRELVEILVQSYQMYQWSSIMSHHWANASFVAVLVLNCWANSVIDWFLQQNEPMRRVICLIINTVLDFLASVVIPLAVYVTYLSLQSQTDWYNPTWIVIMATDAMCVGTNTWLDFTSRAIPAIGMMLTMEAVQPLLQYDVPGTTVQREQEMATSRPIRPHKTAFQRIFRLVLVMVGGMLLIIHGLAVYNAAHAVATDSGCPMAQTSWFSTDAPCAILEINCQDHGFHGSGDQLTMVLDTVDHMTLSALKLSNCASLYMPPVIQRLPMLMWLEIFNSTLMDWSMDAAVTSQLHPRLTRVFLIQTNLTHWPMGLIDSNFPSTVIEIGFIATNVSEAMIPMDLYRVWKYPLSRVVFERGLLTRIPDGLTQLKTVSLSLAGNQIRTVAYMEWNGIRNLSLAANPLQSIMLSIDGPLELHLEQTNVTVVGIDPPNGTVYGGNSPLCVAEGRPSLDENHVVVCRDAYTVNDPHLFQFPYDAHMRPFMH